MDSPPEGALYNIQISDTQYKVLINNTLSTLSFTQCKTDKEIFYTLTASYLLKKVLFAAIVPLISSFISFLTHMRNSDIVIGTRQPTDSATMT